MVVIARSHQVFSKYNTAQNTSYKSTTLGFVSFLADSNIGLINSYCALVISLAYLFWGISMTHKLNLLIQFYYLFSIQSIDREQALIKSYDKTDDKFSKKLIDIINITQNAYETFKGSTINEKREFLNFVYSNLTLHGRKLAYELAFPFTEMQKLAQNTTWRIGWDMLRTLKANQLKMFTNKIISVV